MPTWTARPEDYAADAGFVPRLAGPALKLLGDVAGQRVLDLGCGEGSVTAQLRDAGADVLGVDADPGMVAATAARGLEARVADARDLAGVDGPFDAVFSSAVLHWVPQADRVAAAVARVLRPGGRLVVEQGGHGNVAAVLVALRAALDDHGLAHVATPDWSFPTVDEASAVLVTSGFEVRHAALVARPTALAAGMAAWLRTFTTGIAPACGGRYDDVVAAAVTRLAPVLQDTTGAWTADYVRLRYHAVLV